MSDTPYIIGITTTVKSGQHTLHNKRSRCSAPTTSMSGGDPLLSIADRISLSVAKKMVFLDSEFM